MDPLWLFHTAMENDPFMYDLRWDQPIKKWRVSISTLNYRKVFIVTKKHISTMRSFGTYPVVRQSPCTLPGA